MAAGSGSILQLQGIVKPYSLLTRIHRIACMLLASTGLMRIWVPSAAPLLLILGPSAAWLLAYMSNDVQAIISLININPPTSKLKCPKKPPVSAEDRTLIPEVVLESSNNHRTMPVLGFGTASNNLQPQVLIEAVHEAIKLGYRHFDTASVYGSEQTLGAAIAQTLELNLITSRDELFITSKVWCNDAHPQLVIPALKKSLGNLGLEYLDLYLIHWPISARPTGELSQIEEKDPMPTEEEQMPMDFEGVWRAMEEAQRLGLTKAIGISNFSTKKTQHMVSFATIPPCVNQVEMSPFWQQKKLRDFCKANGIVVTAFSPLGAIGTSWGANHVLESNVLNEIAEAHGKSVAQVCIRWILQVGATLAVKSYNKERLKQNVQVFDWELTQEDLEKISQIPQGKLMTREDDLVTATGPYKSLDELWDGEY